MTVSGDSMRPALAPGDRVLILRTRRPRPGDIAAVVDPRDGSRVLLKRVAATSGTTVVVVGDNPGSSTDSRHFGPVPRENVVGVAVYRYSPPERSGRVVRVPVPFAEWPTIASPSSSPRTTSPG